MSEEDSTEEDLPDNVLFNLYREYIGEPDDRIDVYLGFGLFFGGIALAGLGLLLFLISSMFAFESDPFWLFREIGFGMGMMAVPTLLVGILVLLPVDNRAIYAGAAGAAITFFAVIGFSILYPYNFNVEGAQYTAHVVVAYAVGMALVLVSTGVALVAHQIERAKPAPRPADIEPMEEPEPEESYSDEEIRQDIEDAMNDVDITWGGVEKHEGTSLSFNLDDAEYDFSGMDVEATRVTSESSTDNQVQGLKALKGGDSKTATSTSTVDDQTSKLNQLRQQKREDEAADAETATATNSVGTVGIIERLKRFLGFS